MNDIKRYEFDKSWESMRYYLDYRLRFFNFFIAVNGVLLTIVLSHLKDDSSKIVVALFSILVSIIMTLIDRKITSLAEQYRKIVMDLSEDLGLSKINSLQTSNSSQLTLRNLFLLLYILIIIIWVALIFLVHRGVFTYAV